MMRQRCGLGTVVSVGCGVIALIAACAGSDTPPADADIRTNLLEEYGDDDEVGAAGSSMSGLGGSGMGGAGGSGPSRGGSGSTPAGGSGSISNGGGAPVGGPPCNAVEDVFAARCAQAGCHAAGSFFGDFAASEEAAAEYVDEPSPSGASCGLWINSANPARSMIYTKLTGAAAGCGQRMPLSGDFLTEEQSACVLSWLTQFGE